LPHPNGAEIIKGRTVRPLKWYMIWV